MRYPVIIPLLFILTLTFSCKNDAPNDSETQALEESTTQPAGSFPSMPASGGQEPAAATQGFPQFTPSTTTGNNAANQNPAPATQVIPPQPATQNSGNQGPLNPAHGQPGHRCEIPVGAPLSSAPKVQQPAPANMNTQPVQPNNTNPVNTIPVNTSPSTEPANTVTPPGMNPPHGQPGHKCEIPVGAPLPPN